MHVGVFRFEADIQSGFGVGSDGAAARGDREVVKVGHGFGTDREDEGILAFHDVDRAKVYGVPILVVFAGTRAAHRLLFKGERRAVERRGESVHRNDVICDDHLEVGHIELAVVAGHIEDQVARPRRVRVKGQRDHVARHGEAAERAAAARRCHARFHEFAVRRRTFDLGGLRFDLDVQLGFRLGLFVLGVLRVQGDVLGDGVGRKVDLVAAGRRVKPAVKRIAVFAGGRRARDRFALLDLDRRIAAQRAAVGVKSDGVRFRFGLRTGSGVGLFVLGVLGVQGDVFGDGIGR